MSNVFITIPLSVFMAFIYLIDVFAHNYKVLNKNNHVIHIVTLSPNIYDMKFIKARNTVIGRETVPEIAERANGDIAINGGFFEIGNGADGMPSRNLVIDGKIFSLKFSKQSVITKHDSGRIVIQEILPEVFVEIAKQKILIDTINQSPLNQEITLFTDSYGSHTLTSFKKRKEIAFDGSGNIINVYKHGNNPIPLQGYILSLPISFTVNIKKANLISLHMNINLDKSISMLTGIPLLVKNGEIVEDLYNKKSTFYLMAHARTAIGYKLDGTIIIVIAEHANKRNINDVTLAEIKSIIRTKRHILKRKSSPKDITINEIKKLVAQEFTSKDNAQGLSILELAELMKNLGCRFAINLDGGGSTTLWIKGNIINNTAGDIDESNGMKVIRHVSDAIIFAKKRVVN
jgi:exopolysaccharide biosynthesis protein